MAVFPRLVKLPILNGLCKLSLLDSKYESIRYKERKGSHCGQLRQRWPLIIYTRHLQHAMASEGESGSLRDEAGNVSDSRTGRDTARKSRRGGTAGTSRLGEVHFVNISHPSDVGSQMTDIRRFVMRGGNQQRRAQESRPENPPSTCPRSDNSSPSRSLPPLGSFPVPGDTRMLELVRFGKVLDLASSKRSC